MSTPTPMPTVYGPSTPTPTPSSQQTYTNTKYGFQISYPPSYKALDDQTNLYGWPKAVVLFYKGGQSYDIAVEVWDTQAEYLSKYPNGKNMGKDITVKQIGNKYITLTDFTFAPDNAAIIASFKLTQ